MKKIKTNSKKYPLKIVIAGCKITVPKQSEFSNKFLREHGCSIMAEYVALQWLGIHKWPIKLLGWHKKHTKSDIKSKVTLRGITKGIKKIGKKKGTATYHETVTADRIRKAMREGALVIMEQKNPIHSIALIPERRKNGYTIYRVSYGKVNGVTAGGMADTATTNKTYRGMIVVKRK